MKKEEKMFEVWDLYEFEDYLGIVKGIDEVKKLAKERYYDTDGECSVNYRESGTVKFTFLETF